jgi:hypothetical protein
MFNTCIYLVSDTIRGYTTQIFKKFVFLINFWFTKYNNIHANNNYSNLLS